MNNKTEIPNGWEVKRLGDICTTFKSGNGITSESIFENGEYAVYGGNGLRGYTNSYTHDGNYFLIGRQGALCGNIVRITGKNYISEHAIAVQTNIENDSSFLAYKLEFQNLNRLSESSAQPGLSVEKLLKIKVLLPSLHEQKNIAHTLSTWDKAIEKTSQLITQKENRKKWLMQQLLTGKKRLKGFKGEWNKFKLGELLEEYNKKTEEENIYPVMTSSKRGLVLQKEYFGENRITERDNTGFNIIPPKYITYRSRSDDRIFTFNINEFDFTGLISTYYPVFKMQKGSTYFLKTFLNFHSNHIGRYSVGTSQVVLSFNELSKIIFKLPNESEQTAIASILLKSDEEITLLKNKLEQLKEQKKGLMQMLLTGKKRLKLN